MWKKVSVRTLALIICVIQTIVPLTQVIAGKGSAVVANEIQITNWTPEWWWKRTVSAGYYNFHIDSNITYIGPINNSASDYLIGTICAIGFYARRIQAVHCSLLIFMATLTLWTETKAFLKILNQSQYIEGVAQTLVSPKQENMQGYPSKIANWQLIRQKYFDLQQLANLINHAFGPNVLFCTLETILYYAISLDEVLKHGDYNKVAEALYFLFELVYICLIILFAADIPHRINNFKRWLAIDDNRINVPADIVHIIYNELDNHIVAIKCWEIFPITYFTVANMLGLAVTYFIICFEA